MNGFHGARRMTFAAIVHEHIRAAVVFDRLDNEPNRSLAHVGKRPDEFVVGRIGFHRFVILLVAGREQAQEDKGGGELCL